MGFKGWPKMQCDKPRANECGRLNMVCFAKKTTFEDKWEKMMIGCVNNQVPISNPMQELKHA